MVCFNKNQKSKLDNFYFFLQKQTYYRKDLSKIMNKNRIFVRYYKIREMQFYF